jgi:prepilin-type processing-associated H-X9-DG protein
MMSRSRPRGLNAIEVIVVLAILSVVCLMVLVAMPRGREQARLAGCRKNLMEIGVALVVFDESEKHLPEIELTDESRPGGDGPLKQLLTVLNVPDLRTPAESRLQSKRARGFEPGERLVPGFLCPSDPNATAGHFAAPVSYRATTGDAPDGRNGAFAPGRRTGLAAIEASDGVSYTAAFSERLVGNQRPVAALSNYSLSAGSLAGSGCPPDAPSSAWRGDAGSSWVAADWGSTLYNHTLTPNTFPSCIAADARSALMGASSGHVGGVNLLLLDGSVRTIPPRIDPRIWHEWAAFSVSSTASRGPTP